MTARYELFNHPRLSFEAQPDGSTVARFAMNGWGADIVCRYWPVNEPGHDPWIYDLGAIEGAGGRFSHVTEYGCKLMIVRHLIDAGLIGPAEDNSRLDEINTLIVAETEAARETMIGKPRVGDFVIMPDGSLERCSYAWPAGHGMQTTHGGCFHVTRCGNSSFSGSLNRAQLWEYFKDTGEIRRGKFWFFSHNRAGAGRGVDVFLPCRVYRLEPFAMSEAEARAHPKAVRAAEVWGADHPDHLTAVRALMEARA